MIIAGGFNVYPGEIEQVVWSHPAVEDCAVIGLPDEECGEAMTEIIEVKPNAEVTEPELLTYCRARLSGVKSPKHIHFSEALPRSATGKVLEHDLRAPNWSGRKRSI